MKEEREDAIRNHRKMWEWIAEQYENGLSLDIDDMKKMYMTEHHVSAFLPSNCFLCKYVQDFGTVYGYDSCSCCPVKWPDVRCCNITGSGLYDNIFELSRLLNGKKQKLNIRKKLVFLCKLVASLTEA